MAINPFMAGYEDALSYLRDQRQNNQQRFLQAQDAANAFQRMQAEHGFIRDQDRLAAGRARAAQLLDQRQAERMFNLQAGLQTDLAQSAEEAASLRQQRQIDANTAAATTAYQRQLADENRARARSEREQLAARASAGQTYGLRAGALGEQIYSLLGGIPTEGGGFTLPEGSREAFINNILYRKGLRGNQIPETGAYPGVADTYAQGYDALASLAPQLIAASQPGADLTGLDFQEGVFNTGRTADIINRALGSFFTTDEEGNRILTDVERRSGAVGSPRYTQQATRFLNRLPGLYDEIRGLEDFGAGLVNQGVAHPFEAAPNVLADQHQRRPEAPRITPVPQPGPDNWLFNAFLP